MFGFSTLMIHSKLLDNNNENNNLIFSENLYKGACVKIKNSNKTFQVIGLNISKEICWGERVAFCLEFKKNICFRNKSNNLTNFLLK